MGEKEGTQFAVKIRELFSEKGIPMDRGQRYLGPEKVIQIKTVSSESEDNNTESEMNSPTQVNSV